MEPSADNPTDLTRPPPVLSNADNVLWSDCFTTDHWVHSNCLLCRIAHCVHRETNLCCSLPCEQSHRGTEAETGTLPEAAQSSAGGRGSSIQRATNSDTESPGNRTVRRMSYRNTCCFLKKPYVFVA